MAIFLSFRSVKNLTKSFWSVRLVRYSLISGASFRRFRVRVMVVLDVPSFWASSVFVRTVPWFSIFWNFWALRRSLVIGVFAELNSFDFPWKIRGLYGMVIFGLVRISPVSASH